MIQNRFQKSKEHVKIAKMAKFEFEFDFVEVWIFDKLQRFVWKMLLEGTQQHFPYKSFKFSQNSNCRKNSLFNARTLRLDHFFIFDMLFSLLLSILLFVLFLTKLSTTAQDTVAMQLFARFWTNLGNLRISQDICFVRLTD